MPLTALNIISCSSWWCFYGKFRQVVFVVIIYSIYFIDIQSHCAAAHTCSISFWLLVWWYAGPTASSYKTSKNCSAATSLVPQIPIQQHRVKSRFRHPKGWKQLYLRWGCRSKNWEEKLCFLCDISHALQRLEWSPWQLWTYQTVSKPYLMPATLSYYVCQLIFFNCKTAAHLVLKCVLYYNHMQELTLEGGQTHLLQARLCYCFCVCVCIHVCMYASMQTLSKTIMLLFACR
jgi:hypothetical protein